MVKQKSRWNLLRTYGTQPWSGSERGSSVPSAEVKFCRTHTSRSLWGELCNTTADNSEHELLLSTGNRNACSKTSLSPSSVAGSSNSHSQAPCRAGDWTSDGGTWYLWVLSLQLAKCQLSGAYNFEMLLDFWKTFAHTTRSRWKSIAENSVVKNKKKILNICFVNLFSGRFVFNEVI